MNLTMHRICLLATLVLFFGDVWSADVWIVGGDVSMTISSATAGQNPNSVTDETCQLQWATKATDPVQKITVQTSLAAPKFTLAVAALDVSSGDGTAVGSVYFGNIPTDFIVDIPADIPLVDPGTCTLRYRASANADDGTGTDIHTVTYTITDQ